MLSSCSSVPTQHWLGSDSPPPLCVQPDSIITPLPSEGGEEKKHSLSSLLTMETTLGVLPGPQFLLSSWLLLSTLRAFPNAKADISCAPCLSPMQVNYAEESSDSRKYPTHDPNESKPNIVLHSNIGVTTDRETEGFSGISSKLETHAKRTNSRAPLGNFTDSSVEEGLFSDEFKERGPAPERPKRSAQEFAEGPDARSEMQKRNSGLRAEGQSKRAEVRWSRDEDQDARGSESRAEEPKLTCSTFALAGDSAHNHAVVYWTGKNSSVSPQTSSFHNVV
ncbi:hypothetical protein DNTS_002694 [Danionella cerebrum]|uniref:Uncharacterized protein n=1 Tax=Danionella cerebrum TaxID=2873325 RepID=A0A553RFD9_9TELE|nr:hypothetical protein DNTS_002694 [Danionella translucida]